MHDSIRCKPRCSFPIVFKTIHSLALESYPLPLSFLLSLILSYPSLLQSQIFTGRRPPEQFALLYQNVSTKRLPRAAKLMVWMLGRVKQPAESADKSEGHVSQEDAVLLGLERLGNLLEQYFHPSNNGR